MLLRGDRVSRNWATVTFASLLRLGLGFLGSVVVARALGPESFGIYAILGVVATVAGVLVDPGLTPAAVRSIAAAWSDDSVVASRLAGVFVWTRMAIPTFGLLVAGAVIVVAGSDWLGPRIDIELFGLTLAGVVVTAGSGALAAVLQAIGRFGRLSVVLVANSFLTVLLAWSLAHSGQLSLITSVAILGIGTSLVSVILSIWLLPTFMRPGIPDARYAVGQVRKLLAFGRWVWVGDLLTLLSARIDLPVAALLLDPLTFGAYAVALNLASKADVVIHSLFTVLLPENASAKTPGATLRFLIDCARRVLPVAGIIAVIVPLAPPLIATFYGARFAGAAPMLQGLLVIAIIDLLVAPLLLLPYQLNRPRLLAISDTARAATVIGLSFLLIPTFGVTGAVLARLGSRLVGIIPVAAGIALGRQRSIDMV